MIVGAPVVAEAIAGGLHLVHDELHQELVAAKDRAQPLDRLLQLGQLVEDLLALEPGQPLQLHVQDGLRLDLGQRELRQSILRALPAGLFDARISRITSSR